MSLRHDLSRVYAVMVAVLLAIAAIMWLMLRQRLDHRTIDGEHWIEQVRQPDAMCLGDEPKELPVTVEAPGLALLRQMEAPFVRAVQHFV